MSYPVFKLILRRVSPHVTALLAFLLASCLASLLKAEPPPHNFRGIPDYRIYTERDFDSSATANFIAISRDGHVYYCDQSWLFFYDGADWHKVYDNSGQKKITALYWDQDGTVYASGYNEICELTLDENNQVALRDLAPPEELNITQKLETITKHGDIVYFRGRRNFVSYDTRTGEADVHAFDTWITNGFILEGVYYIVKDNNEIFRYENKQFVPAIPELTSIVDQREITISSTEVDEDGSLIMASERRGIFRWDGQTLEPAYRNFHPKPEYLLREIKLLENGRLIVATLGGGIIVLDKSGNTLDHFDKSIDYRFQSARSITIDQSGAIWATFSSSIAKILLDSELTPIDEHLRPSLFYATQHLFEGDLYVRSFYKLYRAYYDENDRISGFEEVLADQDFEVWSVTVGTDGMYINTADDGLFRWSNDTLTSLSDSAEFDRLVEPARRPDLLVGGNGKEIVLYRKAGDELIELDRAANPVGFVNRMEEDAEGNLWLEYGFNHTGRVRIEDERLLLDVYTLDDGLPAKEWITIWMHQGKAYYTHSQGIITLDQETGRFVHANFMQEIDPDFEMGIERAFTDPEGNLWISARGKNLIYWRQDDGSYRLDENALSEIGEPYFEFLTTFDGGEALIMTSFEFFHYRPDPSATRTSAPPPQTIIAQIRSASDDTIHFNTIGLGSTPQSRDFNYSQNSLSFNVANKFSYSTRSPKFQYILEGFTGASSESSDTQWTSDSSVYYTNLNPGSYTFKVRAQLGNGEVSPWTSYAFSIKPPFYQTYLAYAIYLVILLLIVQISVELYSKRLKRQNLRLEGMVAERTQEIESKNLELENKNEELASQSDELSRKASQLADALDQLRSAQDQLLATARTAGRAEVATNVLHNVGNVLNSVNIGLSNLSRSMEKSRIGRLKQVSKMLNAHRENLAEYLTTDEKGVQVPAYLDKLADALGNELSDFSLELRQIGQNIEHIKRIITAQQAHAKTIGIVSRIDVSELLDSALAITLDDSDPLRLSIRKDYPGELAIESDKHQLLEVLINLIKNAKESILERGPDQGEITIGFSKLADAEQVEIRIADNGLGIASEHLKKLFSHGFTTKSEGHGFGLHSCANTIKNLGGRLRIDSEGLGKGAVANIHLPLKAQKPPASHAPKRP
ncbi:ATP-binding protein [Pelagicoccus sp. SDUM812003]|uniref:ATP-binding protein n=1 Tax=Pelagicoccus sp. SDUM812003 TaxID=3041267 RepID=UPI00280FA178|nr:ATP-binding protein [Pelagicoccus sp. SDUM812003]MDQ8203539.1 ATP-binding protein [Pelagicoccus sp. SDUM812003]